MFRFTVVFDRTPRDRIGQVRDALLACKRREREDVSVDSYPELKLHVGYLGAASQKIWNENRDICLYWSGELFQDSSDLGELAAPQLAPSQLGPWILQQYEKDSL